MNLKSWFGKKKETPEEPPKPPTRAEKMFEFFIEWGKDKPFSHKNLVGIGQFQYDCGIGGIYFFSLSDFYEGNITIQHNNTTVLSIDKDSCYSDNGNKARTTTYDETYSEQLNEYMEALNTAIADRDEAKHKAEEAATAQRILEETRF